MNNIADVDSNFKIETTIEKQGIRFYDVNSAPISLHGVYSEDGFFRRMPSEVAKTVNAGVSSLHTNTSGGRVRFRTNSPYIALYAEMGYRAKFAHCTFACTAGFDMYVGERHIKTFVPSYDREDIYEGIIEMGATGMREYTINFPTYSNVKRLFVGIDEGAVIESPAPYTYEKPVVFYGSSITQGGCASRSGNVYASAVSRYFDCDFINLGFSGSAKGEREMAEYIKTLDMSLFIYDYDHNAPTIQHLADTHEPFFKIIRENCHTLPIIILPRPVYYVSGDAKKRRDIIYRTYENARAAGDENVYFIENGELTELCRGEGTVDNCHPNDFGFASMARAVIRVIEENGIMKPKHIKGEEK